MWYKMYNDEYFDQLALCENDLELVYAIISLVNPDATVNNLKKLFSSDSFCLRDVNSIRYNLLCKTELLGEKGAFLLKMMGVFVDRYNKIKIKHVDVIKNNSDLNNYLYIKYSCYKNEYLLMLLLDSKNAILKEIILSVGTHNFVAFSPEKIIQKIFEYNSTAFLIVHNHPCGNPYPSDLDIQSSQKLDTICRELSITFHDHIIIGRNGAFSLKEAGLF